MRKRKTRKIGSSNFFDESEDIETEDNEENKMTKSGTVESRVAFSIGDIDEQISYNWIVFKLDDKYYMGFEGEEDIQAIKVSEKFYNAFKDEFNQE